MSATTPLLSSIRLCSFFIFFQMLVTGCSENEEQQTMFTSLDAAQTGIHFTNTIEETDSTKSFINEFGYMGGGVGIGDFNNDGLKDIYFTGNQVRSRMYLNKGNNRFEDVTEKAGVQTNIWATGVSVVDINSDGYDDIYVCSYGSNLINRTANLLFINQADGTFKEQAAAYGLADSSYSSQATFFDYDKDGDLDMYLANYMLNGPNANTLYRKDTTGRSAANDRLYRNDGDTSGAGHPVFTDVTLAANIKDDGMGLGVVVTDVNGDNWPDIYVANDFVSDDVLWINKGDGSFTNGIAQALQHSSYSSMGVDAADINNDGRPDITTLDMLPETNERKKTSYSLMNYNRYEAERNLGYHPQFVRNMLQLNNGTHQVNGIQMPFFSEIGQMAGIAATDWSWSVLVADFNNDSWKDMHITNGIGRDFVNGDFLEFSGEVLNTSNSSMADKQKAIREKLASLEHVLLPNYLFINKGDYTFSDVSSTAGIGEQSMSNGAAYADLDNDGDLDLVVNNINSKAFVLLNKANDYKPANNHFLKLRLNGAKQNLHGLGSTVYVYSGGQMQVQEQNPVKGYFSTVDNDLLFGLGKATTIDSVVVVWPNDRMQVLRQLQGDSTYTLNQNDATVPFQKRTATATPIFASANSALNIGYLHRENQHNDFDQQRLLPQKFSRLGPFITTGDINGDGLEDFFVGGAYNASGQLFFQQANGSFSARDFTDSIKMEEDADCLLFDADGDADLDLIITNGETMYPDGSPFHKPRLYFNDGKGNFTAQPDAIPATVTTIAGTVVAGDYDGDGDQDLFIGGRVSGQFPVAPNSYILQNNGGRFTDVTDKVCPKLRNAGMITAAAWADYDGNGTLDLVVAGEWMPVLFFSNEKGALKDATALTGLQDNEGMWRSLAVTDLDGDGDLDVVAGNLGANCIYHAEPRKPMQLMAADIDRNGSIDPVLFYHIKDADGSTTLRPNVSRGHFAEQVPMIKKKYLRHANYVEATPADIFKGVEENKVQKLVCKETRSSIFENMGGGQFKKRALPQQAQFAPVNAIVCTDINGDGIKDLLLAGNEYQTEVMTGRYDASYGLYLAGNKDKSFTAVEPARSGLLIKGDVKDLAVINSRNSKWVLAAVNNDSLRAFGVKAAKP
ncbi:VCBS repeat-containing protein [Paracnuella aquatica]|uniref:VCBS repeat-containing protein n=1 Tax=Paracnuella aquatica TaxID=2268757 RepID=UPI000DEED83B|nr:VCBS repeat-containing protein [Paracnuella aquatica]RPD51225.1 RNA-binding protein [Paracnuella aquatica]